MRAFNNKELQNYRKGGWNKTSDAPARETVENPCNQAASEFKVSQNRDSNEHICFIIYNKRLKRKPLSVPQNALAQKVVPSFGRDIPDSPSSVLKGV